ncbi:MAG TPA: ABC transporter permease [Candidatus Binatia bacterium]|nr:ABC transporter permease [Candidatus Binatia bacterium]
MKLARGDYKMAVSAIRSARWRSWLTMLGIIIGIVSVVTIVSVGEGVKNQVSGQINHLGKDLLTIRPGTISANATSALSTLNDLVNPSNNETLTSNDLEVVRNTPNVASALPLSIVPGTVQVSGVKPDNSVLVIGTSSEAPSILNESVEYGTFFSSNTYGQNVAVIGNNLALALFQTNAPLGMSFTFRGQQFLVDGVMNSFDIPPFSLDANFNNAIFIPYQTAESLEGGNAPLYEILAKPTSSKLTGIAEQAINTRLRSTNGGAKNFTVLKQSQSLAVTNSILTLLTSLVSGIAAISLLVGGIGIMNVMLVSVTERTHEIGIRKAVGATNRQIRSQFLTEAIVLSLAASLAAIFIAVLINMALRIFTNLEPALSWQIMLLSTGMALAVGITFGLAPAVIASRKEPISALRHE